MVDKFLMDGHKLFWHLDRVKDLMDGKRVAPLSIDVGLSKGCNIKCNYCFGELQGNLFKKGLKNYFPREPLLRYVKDAGKIGVRSMAIIGEGEPTLNPHLYDAIVEGSKAGVDMSLATNGILYDDGKKGEEALEHLTWIRFNLSAASDKSYRIIHGSKEFDKAIEKIKFVVDTKKRNNLDVTVGLQMVLTPSNIDEVLQLTKLGKELGVDYFVIKQCCDTITNSLGVYEKLEMYKTFKERLQEAETQSTKDYNVIVKWAKIEGQKKRNHTQCLGAPLLAYSAGDGKLFPCGMFFAEKYWDKFLMGDLTKDSFIDIIKSDRYWEVIERVKNMGVKECYTGCKTTPLNDFMTELKDGRLSLTSENNELLLKAKDNRTLPDPKNPPEHVNFI